MILLITENMKWNVMQNQGTLIWKLRTATQTNLGGKRSQHYQYAIVSATSRNY